MSTVLHDFLKSLVFVLVSETGYQVIPAHFSFMSQHLSAHLLLVLVDSFFSKKLIRTTRTPSVDGNGALRLHHLHLKVVPFSSWTHVVSWVEFHSCC